MAHPDLVDLGDPVHMGAFEGIAEPHRSTVAAIVHGARHGLFTDAQAQVMIDRVRGLTGPATAGV
ncbi:MAG: hypothetical protein ABW215_17195 [Kibdelosporangium sp.]